MSDINRSNVNDLEIAWRVPLGEGSHILRDHPMLRGVGLGSPGGRGPMVTRGGLVFIGSGARHLYAFDKAPGEEVWRGATSFQPGGNPMTCRARAGRQFVVVPTGAGPDAALVAFALPN